MPQYTLLTAREPEYRLLVNTMPRADGPAFLEHDAKLIQYWHQLDEVFPDHQFCLVEETTGQAAALGNSLPLEFHDEWADLPPEGLDWVLEKGFQDYLAGRVPNVTSALYIEIAATHRGHNLSARMLQEMRGIARSQGFDHLIAPVRPSLKHRYPLIDIDIYLSWQTQESLPFDPWLRVHVRAGGHILHPCLCAMKVRGARDQWAGWLGLPLPADGDYIIPHGLVPLRVRDGIGEYVEPGVWVLHEVSKENQA